ncbi:hypothetical protein TBLA_0C00930 [Henningerozyma blattae CBS 6284]|uniref:Pre-mRNA-processing protein PRP40 n=1 Tax=Henningerozyma blattae (strain ATCC 34711 / CBS 6284 / DSM 70876 / NBRC 10599 / NRRL Y-10934 / UCD 77-7) TaxID=1071380 RepID=I2H0K6_HENB6|nr:hypothetical protein TBLA_0C00930 [Tetrapisispora blattae CBS 6284]CCH59908.1 hypothetical protein TBLA_0C00930 [Tetrapisispora blattae CBS 6284]
MENDWKQAKDPKGRVYYYNLKTKESRWDLPKSSTGTNKSISTEKQVSVKKNELKNKIDLEFLKLHGWRTAQTKEGRIYYYNVDTKESRWDPPNLPKNTSLKNADDIIKNDSPVEPLSTSRPEQNMHDSEKKQPTFENKADVHSESLTHSNLSGSEDLEKYNKKSMIQCVTQLTKSEAEDQFIQMLTENQVDSTWSFGKIISDLGTVDPRYWVVDDDPSWKQQIFEKYLSNRSEDQLIKESNEISKFHDAFILMLKSKSEIKYYTRWGTAKRIFANEPIYVHSAVSKHIQKKVYKEYIDSLINAQEAFQAKTKEQALKELRLYLDDIIFNNSSINKSKSASSSLSLPLSWSHLYDHYLFEKSKRYTANKHFKLLTHEDVLKLYIELLEKYQQRQKQCLMDLNKINYTNDRLARDNFKILLNDSNDFKIRANSKWSDIYPIIKNNKSFLRLVGRNGSTPLDLFYDIREERDEIINGQRSIANQLLIDKNFQWITNDEERIDFKKMTHDNYLSIKEILLNDSMFSALDDVDLDIIIERLIKQKWEKNMEYFELQQRLLNEKIHNFNLLLSKYYRGSGSSKDDSWNSAKGHLKEFKEFKDLENNESLMIESFNNFIHNDLKIIDEVQTGEPTTASVNQTLAIAPVTRPSKKRTLPPTTELDY